MYTLLLAYSLWIGNISQFESSELVSTCQFPVYNYYKLYFCQGSFPPLKEVFSLQSLIEIEILMEIMATTFYENLSS